MTQYIGTSGNDSISGSNGADIMRGLEGADTLWGADGFDRVFGGAGDDRVDDSRGGDLLYGGSGVDTLRMFYGTFFGGGIGAFEFTFVAGQDTVTPFGSTARGFERVDITGSDGNDTITGGRNDDLVRGWQGNDSLNGGDGGDFMIGDNGSDTLFGGAGRDYLTGGGDEDTLYGGAGADTLVGGGSSDVFDGVDLLIGGAGADEFRGAGRDIDISYADSRRGVYVDLVLGRGFGGDAQGDIYVGGDDYYEVHGKVIGSAFDDLIVGGVQQFGGDGDDRLVTSIQTQGMTGGAGRDVFAFDYADAAQYYRPLVTDFGLGAISGKETLDVSTIDARPMLGDQSFVFIGTAAFSEHRAGELRYEIQGGQTVVEMNTNGDASPDLAFVLDGVFVLEATDFML